VDYVGKNAPISNEMKNHTSYKKKVFRSKPFLGLRIVVTTRGKKGGFLCKGKDNSKKKRREEEREMRPG